MHKLNLEKAEEPEIKLPTSAGLSKKQESSRKTSTSVLLTMPKPLTAWITINCGKFLKRWEYYQTTWPASWEIYMQVKKQQLKLDIGQRSLVGYGPGYRRELDVTERACTGIQAWWNFMVSCALFCFSICPSSQLQTCLCLLCLCSCSPVHSCVFLRFFKLNLSIGSLAYAY